MTTTANRDDTRLQRARWATVAVFLLLGMLLGSWFSGIPRFQRQLDLGDSALGLILLAPTIGSMIGMQVAAALVRRFSAGPVVRITAVTLPFTLPLIAVAHRPVYAAGGLLLFGIVDGIQGVAMNVHGITVERRMGRPILNGVHAAWGIGALLGGLGGTIAVATHLSLTEHFLVVAVAGSLLGLAAGGLLLPAGDDATDATDKRAGGGWRAGWSRSVLLLGIIGAGVMICEVGISNWGAVFLSGDRAAPATLASIGYVVFSAAETGTRLVGDRIVRRFGPVPVVRISGLVGVVGLVLVVLPHSVPVNLAGFAVFGIGIAIVTPVIFSAVGHANRSEPGAAVARYTTLTYLGVLGGPALVGALAHVIGLPGALACMLAPLALVVLGATLTRTAASGRDQPEASTAATAASNQE
jgi:fucose permease